MKGKFPNNLKRAMAAASIGPTELARVADTHKQNISRWADQERRLTPEVARILAPALGTTWDQLLVESREVPLVGYVGAGAAFLVTCVLTRHQFGDSLPPSTAASAAT